MTPARRTVAKTPTVWWLLVAACGGGEGETARFTVRDSAGVAIAQNAGPLIREELAVSSVPSVVVQGDFDDPEHFLFNVNHAVPLPSGGFVVGNSGTQQLYFFAPDGSFLRSVGGQGDGPGELQRIFGLSRCDSGLLAVEEVRRISFFSDDGAFRGTTRITGHLAEFRAELVAMSSDCKSGLMSTSSEPVPASKNDLLNLHGPLYWASFETGQRDTVAVVNIAEAHAIEFRGGLMWLYLPYGPRCVFASDGETVVFGSSRTFEVRRLDRAGMTQSIVRWAGAPAPVSNRDWAFFVESHAELLEMHPEERPFLPDVDLFMRPSQKPAYKQIILDDANRIWIQAYERYRVGGPTSSPNWLVFDESGRWLARVRLPEGLTVLAVATDWIIGTAVDEFDVQRIQLHRVPSFEPTR